MTFDDIFAHQINGRDLERLFEKSLPMLIGKKDHVSHLRYTTKKQALTIIYDGYTALSDVYTKTFVNPMIQFLQANDYGMNNIRHRLISIELR